MSKLQVAKGTSSKIIRIVVPDATSTNGGLLTGKVFSKFRAWYAREGEAAPTVLTAQDITALGTYQAPTTATDFRIKEFNKGVYEIHLRNELFAIGSDTLEAVIHENVVGGETEPGADNIPPIPLEIELTDFDLYSPATTASELAALINKGKVLVTTTIATLASQTSFTLTDGSGDNNAYNDRIIIVVDQATATQVAVGKVSTYVGGTRTVTLAADPAIFTMAVGDTVVILAQSPTATGGGGAVADAVLADINSRTNNPTLGALLGVADAAGETLAVPGYHVRQGNFIQGSTQDKYTCTWARFGVEVTSGITLPKIQVKNLETGADLIAEAAMTPVAGGEFRHLQGAPSRTVDGTAYKVFYKATIGGAERVDTMDIGRDA